MQAPERLGKYLIRRELGRGAMGVVYEGYDPMIERAVAIKVLRLDEGNPELAAELRMRFRREAQAAGRLGHPGIVAVYEYGEDAAAGTAFIAMELVRGRDLKSLFDAGARFTLEQTGRFMEDLLAALQHAHARGVVHRDVKPGNIILLDDGLKVADFGIAKLDTSELTQLGSVLGTVSHMSPEQLTGEAVDGRSDLYSCGVILYQLLTGERPFSGPPASLIHKVLHETPLPPSRRVPALPPELDAVVLKAMAKSPDQRHADAAAFAAELRAALAAPPRAGSSAMNDEATVVLPRAATPAAAAADTKSAASTGSGATSARAEIAQGAQRDATLPLPQQSDPTAAELAAAPSSPWTANSPPPSRATTSITTSTSAATSPSTSASPSASTHAAPARGTRRGVGAAVLGVVGIAVAGAAGYRLLMPRSAGESAVTASASAAFATTPLPTTLDSAPASAVHAAPVAAAPVATAQAASAPTLASIALIAPAPIAPAPLAQPSAAETTAAPAAAQPPVRATVAPGPASAAASRPARVAAVAPATPSNPRPPATTAPAPTTPPAVTPPSPAPAPPPATRVALAPVSPSPLPSVAASTPNRALENVPPSGRDARGRGSAYPTAPADTRAPASRVEARFEPGEVARTAPASPAPAPAPSAAAPPARADTDCLEEARRGNARCQVVVANLYRAGRGVPRDPAEAMRWYRMAAEQGSDAGQYELGLMYENGLGAARDPVQAVAWYRKAAAQGHARAQNMLGRAYESGLAGPSNLVLAADWYRRAADQNLPIAEYNLGRLYLGGRGVFKDAAKGQALLQKAADAGEPNAMVYIADLYARGDGKPRDPGQANRLYRDALGRPGLNDRNRETAQRALAAAR